MNEDGTYVTDEFISYILYRRRRAKPWERCVPGLLSIIRTAFCESWIDLQMKNLQIRKVKKVLLFCAKSFKMKILSGESILIPIVFSKFLSSNVPRVLMDLFLFCNLL